MTQGNFPVDKMKGIETPPYYYYDMDLLKKTLKVVKEETKKTRIHSTLCSKS